MATQSDAIIEKAKAHLLQNYRQSIVIDRGLGSRVWDSDGKQYLDLLGGIATCALGHCHPEVGSALKAQIDKLWHVSNVFYTQPQIDLAQKLTAESGLDRAFFCNSGAEANEAVLKLARKAQKDRGQPDRFEVITFLNSFHGRTLATVTATGQPKYQKGFEPLPAGFSHVPYGDLEAVKKAISPKTAAILVEPIQGEGGVHSAPEGFLRALRTLCDEQGLLLLVDEIQTGMGRTGKFFAYQHEGIRPDAVTLAKALGNGIPIGAMLCREEWAKSLTPGTHGSTFGGNPLAAAAANVVTDLVRDPKMLAAVSAKGDLFLRKLGELKAKHPQKISAVRGRGLLIGLELTTEAGPSVAKARDLGMLCNLAGDRTLRFAPAFTITEAEIEEGVRILDTVLQG